MTQLDTVGICFSNWSKPASIDDQLFDDIFALERAGKVSEALALVRELHERYLGVFKNMVVVATAAEVSGEPQAEMVLMTLGTSSKTIVRILDLLVDVGDRLDAKRGGEPENDSRIMA